MKKIDKAKLMQEIKSLETRGRNYQEQGNLSYSKSCYVKICVLLKNLINQSTDMKSVQLIKEKIEKYKTLALQIEQKQKNRTNNRNSLKISKFDFPIQNKNSLEIIQPNDNFKPIIQQMKKQIQNDNNNINNKFNLRNTVGNRQITENCRDVDPDIENMMVKNIKLSFKDIIGMEQVKDALEQAVILPKKRPDLFKGIRGPPRGLLFYGPPGNGKTYIAKALATQAKCAFFAVSASSIMGKFVGESQRMLKKLFKTAEQLAPSIIFIDQIDSLLTARSQKQNEVSRRVKTQFLVLMDGIMSAKQGQVLLIGATNLPSQLDLAALRRFNKLIYIGLPDVLARQGIVRQNLQGLQAKLSSSDMKSLTKALEGYSASEIHDIVKQVAMLPLRDVKKKQFQTISEDKIRPIVLDDFLKVLKKRKPLLSKQQLKKYQGNFSGN